MPAGRKPRPAPLKLLNGRHEGVDSGGRKVEPGPEFRRLPPLKPMELSPLAAEHWDLVVEELGRLDLTKPLDAGALAAACETWSRFAQAQATINREGLFIKVKMRRGEVEWTEQRVHPAVKVVEVAGREYRAWCSEFGLTPSAEGRLAPRKETGGEDNPFGRPATQ
jgi:P27 family predicted phage terminase small subunit